MDTCTVIVNLHVFEPDYVLPDTLTQIEEAFSGLPVEEIQCNTTLQIIGTRAFADCEHLSMIYIPAAVTEIAEDAFVGCPSNLLILGEDGSLAETYAEEHSMPNRRHKMVGLEENEERLMKINPRRVL